MSKNIGSVNFKLVSQYDNAGVKLAMKDMDASQKMIAGMSSASAGKTDPMMAKLGTWNADQLKAAEALKQADRDYWTQRARLRDQNLARELEAEKQLERERRLAAMSLRDQKAQALRDLQSQMLSGSQSAGPRGSIAAPSGGNKTAMIAQQLGFGLQDFTSQIANSKNGIDGLGRGLMAVSNNVQMLGSAFGPTGLAITAIGGSLVGIVVPQMIKWVDLTKEATKNAELTTKAILDQVEAIAKLRAAERGPEADGGKTAAEESRKNQDAIRVGEERVKALRAQLAEANNIVEVEKNADRERTQRLMNEQKLVPATLDRVRVGLNVMGGGEGTIQSEMRANAEKTAQDLAAELRAQEQALQDNRKKQAAVQSEFGDQIKQDEERRDKERNKKILDDAVQLGEQLRKVEEDKQKAIDKARDEEIERNKKAIQADLEEQIQAADMQQQALVKSMDDLRAGASTPNGPSSASIRGTGAATSAINRALAGTRSEENDKKAQLKALEVLHKDLQEVKQHLNFKRGTI